MPHAAVIAAAAVGAVAVVGTALAFEATVFRPWREENWPEGVLNGVREEWDGIRDEMRRGLWDFRERIQGNGDPAELPPPPPSHRRRSSPPPPSLPPKEYGESTSRSDTVETLWQRRAQRPIDQEMREMQSEFDSFELRNRQRMTEAMHSAPPQAKRLQGAQAQSVTEDDDRHSRSNLIDVTSPGTQDELESPHHDIGQSSPTLSYASLERNDASDPFAEQIVVDPLQQGALRAARINETHSVTSDEEWFSRASSPQAAATSHGDDAASVASDAWTHLEESLPGTPTSGSWSAIERSSHGGSDR